MPKRIAISQSNYIPWKGYFDVINGVDEFVLFDDVQYTKRDWRNRNQVKTPHGLTWLTIAVSASRSHKINEVEIADTNWNMSHWKTIHHLYSKAPHFECYAEAIQSLYESAVYKKLSDINYHFLSGINKLLGITTPLTWSTDYKSVGGPSERLLNICLQAGANIYVTGPAAQNYLDVDLFERQGVQVEWMNYDGYEEYPQLYGAFEHKVSVIDLLFCAGDKAGHFMNSQKFEEV